MARANVNYKGTKKENFNALLAIPAVQENSNLIDFINHELELLANKKSGKGAEQANREEAQDRIITLLIDKGAMKSTVIANELGFSSGQYATARLGELVKQGRVIRTKEKKDIFYSMA